jgi:2-polyprenyl-3-methyl-5-hydroxy-6-metoxy-1,4-benzoquinol methylase
MKGDEQRVELDAVKLQAFVGQAVTELGATLGAALVVIGDCLGLYKAMAGAGPLSPKQLADRTGTAERYVREWLNAQAAGGYVSYDARTERYILPPEQAFALVDDQSPVFLPGAFRAVVSAVRAANLVAETFRTVTGVECHEYTPDLFESTRRFLGPGFGANLIRSWIPSLEDVEGKLRRGATVADICCGYGASTMLMAQAYPASTFVGFDDNGSCVEQARLRAVQAGMQDRVRFEVAGPKEYAGTGYDLVTFFGCLQDVGDPVGVARHLLASLDSGGTWLVVEPFAANRVEENLNPVGRVYYGLSTLNCTPATLAQDDGVALGAESGEARLRAVTTIAGFTRFRRAAETHFNVILEARP